MKSNPHWRKMPSVGVELDFFNVLRLLIADIGFVLPLVALVMPINSGNQHNRGYSSI